MKSKQNESFGQKVYRTRLILRLVPLIQVPIFVIGIILFIAITVQVVSTGKIADIVLIMTGDAMVTFFVYAAAMVSGAYYARLELWENGITFYGGDYRLYTPWENIRAISGQRLPLGRFIKTLELREPANTDISFEQGKALRQAVIEKRWEIALAPKWYLRTRARSIPLVMISKKDWERGNFLQDLRYYAPHLNIRNTDGFYHETDK